MPFALSAGICIMHLFHCERQRKCSLFLNMRLKNPSVCRCLMVFGLIYHRSRDLVIDVCQTPGSRHFVDAKAHASALGDIDHCFPFAWINNAIFPVSRQPKTSVAYRTSIIRPTPSPQISPVHIQWRCSKSIWSSPALSVYEPLDVYHPQFVSNLPHLSWIHA